jgi:hypothetical protein
MSPERDFSTRPRARAFSPPQRTLFLAGIAAAALAIWAAADAWRECRAAEARLLEVRREAESARARARELQERRGPGHAMAAQALLTADAAPPRVVAAVAELLPGDVRLDGISLRYADQVEVELRVAARTPGSFDLFLDRLQSSPSFAGVLPGEEDRRAQMRATIRGRYQPGSR